MSTTSDIPSSGTYILNFAVMGWDGTLSNITTSTAVTFDDSTQFTVNGTDYTYDYTWGNDGSKQIILGNTKGGYYLLTNTDVDPSNYTYQNDSYGTDNHWQITENDGPSATLSFQNRGFDPGAPAANGISARGIPSSGTYILNFAFMGWDGTLSSVMNSAPVTFDDTSHFTINGTQYT